jgi:Lrp/AsnC family leucine-responsive transcriptional regulator
VPIKVNAFMNLDQRDHEILALVQRDAKMPQAEIGRRVGLSTASVNERLKKLEHAGVIRRYTALVDPQAVGASLVAFIEVSIEHPRFEPALIEHMGGLVDVQECHHITGEFSLLLKVRVRDMHALRELLLHQLNSREGVRQTRTIMVLETVKEEPTVVTAAKGVIP